MDIRVPSKKADPCIYYYEWGIELDMEELSLIMMAEPASYDFLFI
jgi:hypothetical protein